jgi:3-isopropylmalate/(R)-2-methylmalate dehydratase small subunit
MATELNNGAHGKAGKAWVFGDEINTDNMAPGLYFKEPMEVLATHCLEAVNPKFALEVKHGDILVAGSNFGMGSAREQAPMALVHLGIGAILAKSYSRIFYRNAINFGLPALMFPQADEINPGDELRVDPVAGLISNITTDRQYQVEGIPPHLMDMITAGGLMPWLKQTHGKSPS